MTLTSSIEPDTDTCPVAPVPTLSAIFKSGGFITS